MISPAEIQRLIGPFGVTLTEKQLSQTAAYLDLLLRWNKTINLTAITDTKECVRRHFGESFFLPTHQPLTGMGLDIGSGGGFPGLALKILCPEVSMTLLEPVTKKRAFLKEACRVCGITNVSVRGERLEELAETDPYDFATMRAVGNFGVLVPAALRRLRAGGNLYLWVSRDQAAAIPTSHADVNWKDPLRLPNLDSTEIWRGSRTESAT